MKFLRKPLAIIAGLVMLVGLVLTVVVAALPHGGKYVYTNEFDTEGVKTKITETITFKDGKLFFEMKTETEGVEPEEDPEPDGAEGMDYVISGGKLYINVTQEEFDKSTDEKKEADGAYKINAFKIYVKLPSDQEAVFGTTEFELKCNTSYALLGVGLALLGVGVVGVAVSVTLIVLDKKKTPAKAAE